MRQLFGSTSRGRPSPPRVRPRHMMPPAWHGHAARITPRCPLRRERFASRGPALTVDPASEAMPVGLLSAWTPSTGSRAWVPHLLEGDACREARPGTFSAALIDQRLDCRCTRCRARTSASRATGPRTASRHDVALLRECPQRRRRRRPTDKSRVRLRKGSVSPVAQRETGGGRDYLALHRPPRAAEATSMSNGDTSFEWTRSACVYKGWTFVLRGRNCSTNCVLPQNGLPLYSGPVEGGEDTRSISWSPGSRRAQWRYRPRHQRPACGRLEVLLGRSSSPHPDRGRGCHLGVAPGRRICPSRATQY